MSNTFRTFPIPEDIDQYEGQIGNHEPCAICGRPLKSKNVFLVHLVDGGGSVLHTEDEEAYREAASNDPKIGGGDLGGYLVGSKCAKHLPKEYRTKEVM